MPNAQVVLTLSNQTGPGIRQTADATKALAAEEARAQQQAVARAQAIARVQVALNQVAVAEQRSTTATNTAAISAQRYVTEQQRTATASNQAATAAQRLQTEQQRTAVQTSNAAAAEDRAALAALRLADAQNKAAKGSSTTAQFTESFKGGLLGMVGPAAVATAAIGVLIGTANSFKEAFSFKTQLDATNTAVASQLRGVRDSGAVFAEAAAFGDKYRITQEQTASILQSSSDVLRTSRSSVTDLELALLRLQSRDPSKPISEAARALRELNSGDVTTIKDLFNISAADALRMRNEIVGGADAVKVLTGYLDKAGSGMDLLTQRTTGAVGALNNAAIAQEEVRLAQAKLAESAGGVFIVEGIARQYRGLANLLNGDAVPALKNTGQELLNSARSTAVYVDALLRGKTQTEAFAIAQAELNRMQNDGKGSRSGGSWGEELPVIKQHATATDEDRVAIGKAQIATQQFSQAIQLEGAAKIDAQIHTANLAKQQAQLEADSKAAAEGIFAAGDQALALARKYGLAVDQARFLIAEQQRIAAAGAPTEGRLERTTTATDRDAVRQAQEARAADAQAARSAQILATGTANQQIAERRRLYQEAVRLHGAESAAAINAQTALTQAQRSAATASERAGTARISAATKVLKTEESIRDAMQAQVKASLDAQELAIRDRQADRDDAQKRKTANAILNSSGASADLKARASDALALIDVQDRKRALELAEKQASAGGAIIGGKLYQSQPSAGGASSLPPRSSVGAPAGANVSSSGVNSAAGGQPIVLQVTLDGKVIAQVTEPYIMDALMHAVRGQRATNGA